MTSHQGQEATPLARLMFEQGRRQKWLAEQIGIDPSHVSRWVTGEREIPIHHVTPIAVVLGVPRNELFR